MITVEPLPTTGDITAKDIPVGTAFMGVINNTRGLFIKGYNCIVRLNEYLMDTWISDGEFRDGLLTIKDYAPVDIVIKVVGSPLVQKGKKVG